MNLSIEYLADRPKFVPQIATWYFNEWGHKEPGNTGKNTRERLYKKLNKDRVPIPIVALTDGKLVGTAQLKIREMGIFPDREFWLGGVYVDSAARGYGVAKLLVRKIEEIARGLGIKELSLQTGNFTGGLYTKSGWMPLEQVEYHGTNILVMHKEL